MTRLPVAVLLLSCLVSPALADGMFLPGPDFSAMRPSSAAQKGIMIREDADEVLLLQTTYHGPANRFAWVVPVPSKPSEMFPAEPAFVTETFKGTEPVVVTRFNQPGHTVATASSSLPAAPGAEAAGGPPPPVQVLEEKDVGDYHAVVLAATRGDELQKWLGKNQYHLPAEAQPVLDDYVRRGWVFVALKMQEKRAREQGVLTEVAPLGLRFKCPAEGLVYPLTVSRVSAPPLTALLLCIIADQPYTCKTIPTAWLTEKLKLRRNQTYGDLRRQMTRNPTRLLCEFSGNPPFLYSDLGYRADDWEQGRQTGLETAKASRFFGLVAPEEMVDLTFAPDADPAHADYRVLVRRAARAVPSRTTHALLRTRVLRPGSEAQAAAISGKPLDPPTQRNRDDSWRVPVAVMLGFLTATVLILRRVLPGAKVIAPLLALGVVVGVAQGGMPGFELLGALQTAVDLFQADTGCLPATVADLAARKQPPKGLDASGNEVEIKGWRGPYLEATPPNPIRGGKLGIDPLNAYTLDSTGFDTTCEPATYAVAQEARGGRDAGMRRYWNMTTAEAAAKMGLYYEWLQDRRGHRLFAFKLGEMPQFGGVSAVVVDRDGPEYFAITGEHTYGGDLLLWPNGQVLTAYPLRPVSDYGSWPVQAGEAGVFCGITAAHSPFSLLPRLPKQEVPTRVGPDGSSLTIRDGRLTVLHRDGSGRSYPFEVGKLRRTSFSRDGRSLYLVHVASEKTYGRAVISRLDLASGVVTHLDSIPGEAHVQVVGPDGVLYVKYVNERELWHVGKGRPRKLIALPEYPGGALFRSDGPGGPAGPSKDKPDFALSEKYAYWARANKAGSEVTVTRLSLRDGTAKQVAQVERRACLMAADGADLCFAYLRTDGQRRVSRLDLITNGGKPVTLREFSRWDWYSRRTRSR